MTERRVRGPYSHFWVNCLGYHVSITPDDEVLEKTYPFFSRDGKFLYKKMYTRIIDFGRSMNNGAENPLNVSNPLTYCMLPTYNNRFIHGPTASGLVATPYAPQCQEYMAARCASDDTLWDGFCRGYREINRDTYWPNSAAVNSQVQDAWWAYLNIKPTDGDYLLRNALERRFLRFGNHYVVQPFDPNVANSPMFEKCTARNTLEYTVQNLASKDAIEKDALLTEALATPAVCMDVFFLIFLHYREGRLPIVQGTRLGNFLDANRGLFEGFLARRS